MSNLIKQKGGELFLRSEIDPGGMSVFWVNIKLADKFGTKEEADSFIERCKERYPDEEFEVFGYE